MPTEAVIGSPTVPATAPLAIHKGTREPIDTLTCVRYAGWVLSD